MLVIRGKVDEWRRERQYAYLIHASLVEDKHRVNMYDTMPLPFDDEIKESGEMTIDEVDQTMKEYNQVMEQWSNNDPFKK